MALLSAYKSPGDGRLRFLRAVLRDGMEEANPDRRTRPLTVVQAAEQAGLSRPSAQTYAGRLQKAGLVNGSGLRIAPAEGFVIGVDIRETKPVRIAVCDAAGQLYEGRPVWPTSEELAALTSGSQPAIVRAKQLLDWASVGIKTCIEQLDFDPRKLIGVGISLPGPVVDGLARGENASPWNKLRADQRLARRLADWIPQMDESLMVTRSDAYASAVTERLWGVPEAAVPHMIYVKWSVDLRAAIVLNGELYTGYKGTAGELGHIQIKDRLDAVEVEPGVTVNLTPRDKCGVCGSAVCLHTFAGIKHLSQVATADAREFIDGEEIAMAAGNNPPLDAALRIAARSIGGAVASYVAALNPQAVVLGGAIGSRVFDLIEEEFVTTISERAVNAEGMMIVGARSTSNTAVLGVAACALLERGPEYFKWALSA